MPKMVANRDVRVASLSGHVMLFEEGVIINVPRVVVAECQAVGILLAPGETLESLEGGSPAATAPGGAERLDRIKDATRIIVARNQMDDFGAAGRPTARAIDAHCGFKTDSTERDTCWAALQYDNQQRREKEAKRRRKPSDKDELYEAVATVLDALVERGAEDDFSRDGVPHVRAIEEFLGYALDHAERDAMWKRYKARADTDVEESTEEALEETTPASVKRKGGRPRKAASKEAAA